MVPSCSFELRFETLFEKKEGLFFVFVKKDSCKPERVLGAKIQHDMFYVHLFSPSSHFLMVDFMGRVPLVFTLPLMMRAGLEGFPY